MDTKSIKERIDDERCCTGGPSHNYREEVLYLLGLFERIADALGEDADDASIVGLLRSDIARSAVCEMEHNGPTGWRSVDGEDVPEEGQAVLLWCLSPGTEGVPTMQRWGSDTMETYETIGITHTHWMPLPSAPEEG